MYTSAPHSAGWEFVKWFLLLALATMAALSLIGRIADGAESAGQRSAPVLLSSHAAPAAPGSSASVERAVNTDESRPEVALARRLRVILDDHQAGDIDTAIDGWLEVELPYESEAWRHVALADAYLKKGQLENMAGSLAEALRHDPENAVAHYYTALLRLEQAATARQWQDTVARPRWQLVSHPLNDVVPNTIGMYRLVASYELEKAVECAELVPWNRHLMPVDCTRDDAEFGPTVGDLLVSIGAERFEGDSHHVLGDMYLTRGSMRHAEAHFDRAAALGTHVMFGYTDLGRQYEEQGSYLDAAGAYAKQIRQNDGVVTPAIKMIENLRNALGTLW
jgi:tetratricopeptide (TPR) repeat protein